MELDELKKIWEAKNAEVKYSKPALKDIFEVRVKRAIGRINKNMLWDAILMITATVGFIAITFILGLKDRYMISGELLLIATILFIHYRIKHLTINSFNFENNGVGGAVKKVIRRLKGYIFLYKILVPAMTGGLFLLYQANLYYYQFGSYSLEVISGTTIFIALAIAVVAYFLTTWVTYNMYGKELIRLKQLSEDIEVD